jgi:molecular chaperone GrpE
MVKKKKAEMDENNYDNGKITDNKQNSEQPDDGSFSASEEPARTTGSSTDIDEYDENTYKEKLAEMQDKYLRLSAEFDNYRKRTLREKMDLSKYAGENILLRIIPFMDDFERALKHMEESSDCTSIKDGISLIHSKFSEFLKQNGVKEIEALNIPFNVDLHEAVAKIPVQEDDKKGLVVDVLSKGYYIQDKVLRFTKVVVGE